MTTIVDTGLPAPINEGQARELARVPEPERAEVWRETVERTEGKPTAAATGVSQTQISKDLKSAGVNPAASAAGQSDSGFTPAAVVGLDGKSYAASRPPAAHTWAEPGEAVLDAEIVDEREPATALATRLIREYIAPDMPTASAAASRESMGLE